VVVLCGGRGTRLQEHTREVPKPLVEIGGRPILWHVVMLYAAQGFTRFVLATGYRSELIASFAAHADWPAGVSVRCLETGRDTPTGGRVRLAAELLAQEGRICATYSDGLADIDLAALLAFHAAHGALATVTVVRPQLQFGVAEIDPDGRVRSFREKPRSEHWVNGGFLCLERAAVQRLGADSVLEREPLQELAAQGELRGFRHEGFWRCMDTYKDAVALNDLWAAGAAPWRLWEPGRRHAPSPAAPPAAPPGEPAGEPAPTPAPAVRAP
jgi:glucose-1-phosphate cytidylyltransferase